MYECNEFSDLNQQIVCHGCLKLGSDVRSMTGEEINLYKSYVQTCPAANMMYLCSLCSHLLKKTKKFIDQCQRVSSILIQCANKVIRPSTIAFIIPVYNLSISHLNQENIAIEDNTDVPGFIDNDVFDDEDIPLMLLKSEGSVGGREEIKREECSEEETDLILLESKDLHIREDINNSYIEGLDKKSHKKRKIKKSTKKKELREGFTSKMVQETDEYTVIKLTKEQVLKEMEAKSLSEEYQRSLFKCGRCVKGFNFEDVLNSHNEKHVKKKNWLECDICHQYCPNATSFRGHMKSHTTRYKCKVCGCVRLARQVLLEHHSTRHSADTLQYRCQKCDFVTIKRTSMQRHIRTRHVKTERHPCEQCGKTLHSMEALRAHTARHLSPRLQCDECGQRFVYPTLLDKHKLAVHVRGDYYCVECDVKFKSRCNLELHFKRHRRHRDVSTYKYKCPECDKRFVFPSSLASHVSSAHAPLRFACCGTSYSSRDALRAHQRRAHSGGDAQNKINLEQETADNCINDDMQKKTGATLL